MDAGGSGSRRAGENHGPGIERGAGENERGLTRRALLRDGSAVTIAVLAAGPVSSLGDVAVAVGKGRARFLKPEELETLRALVDRFIPGRPEDTVDGALAGGCAEAIDALLGAFEVDPPKIYAGAPFSDRGGARKNSFDEFLPLDDYERMAWKLRIRGSRGKKKLEFNGPVEGWQKIYRKGLEALNREAGPAGFAALPGPAQDLILRNSGDEAIQELIDVSFPHTYEFMYGAPEYGANKDLLGWDYTVYAGDVLPRGWTREQIEQPEGSSGERPDGSSGARPQEVRLSAEQLDRLAAVAPLASPEVVLGMIARADGRLSGLRAELQPILDYYARTRGSDGS